MRKLIIVAKLSLILALLSLLTGLSVLYFGGSKINQKVVEALHKNISTPASFENVSLEVLEHFPYASIEIGQINIAGQDNSSFIDSGSLSLYLNPIQLIFGRVSIKKLLIENAHINISRTTDGYNYQVFGKGDGRASAAPIFLIKKALLKNTSVRYVDLHNDQAHSYRISQGKIEGTFDLDKLDFHLDLDAESKYVEINNLKYLTDQPFSLQGGFVINLKNKYYAFEDVLFKSDKLETNIEGIIRNWDAHYSYDLLFNIYKGHISSLKKALPNEYTNYLKKFNVKGKFNGKINIEGRSSRHENPKITAQINLNESSVEHANLGERVDVKQAVINFNNGGARNASSSELTISDIRAKQYGNNLGGRATIRNFTFPTLDAELTGALSLQSVNVVSDENTGLFQKGFIDISQCRIHDLWLEFVDVERFFNSFELKGKVVDGLFQKEDLNVNVSCDSLALSNGDLSMSGLNIKSKKSEILISGHLENIGTALIYQSLAPIKYGLNIQASHLDIADFSVNKMAQNEQSPHAAFVNHQKTSLPIGELSFTAENFIWGKRKMRHVTLQGQSLINEAKGSFVLESCGGTIESEVHLDMVKDAEIRVVSTFDSIEISKAFYQWQNFYQSVLSDKQISGRVNGHLVLTIPFSSSFSFIKEKMEGAIRLEINDGRLEEFDMLQSFSTYIHADALKDISFHRMRNYVRIKNGHVYFPSMFIQSDAANLEVNGVHGLNNQILYNIKLNAGQILSNRIKNHRKQKLIPSKKDGFFNLYFSVFGDLDKFEYAMDKRGVRSSFLQSENIRLETYKILAKQFKGLPDWSAPENWDDIPEYDMEESDEVKFLEEIKGEE